MKYQSLLSGKMKNISKCFLLKFLTSMLNINHYFVYKQDSDDEGERSRSASPAPRSESKSVSPPPTKPSPKRSPSPDEFKTEEEKQMDLVCIDLFVPTIAEKAHWQTI